MGKTFQECESECRITFENAVRKIGPFWHIFTPGFLTEIINITPEDYKFSVSNLALCAYETDVMIITDAHMENHLHYLAAGTIEKCTAILDKYVTREKRYLNSIGRDINLSKFRCEDPVPIMSLETMRNEIVYINRNGYVANPTYTPYSYPWGGGCLFFNPYARQNIGIRYNDLPFKEKRLLCRQRVEPMPDNYFVQDGMILPSGYVNYRLGESFYRNAHHYFNLLSRDYEAYSAEAQRLGDTIVLSSEEMYAAVKYICKKQYDSIQPGLLAPTDKIEVAKIMHSKYNATNSQIQRILNLSKQYVDQLFPLRSKQ